MITVFEVIITGISLIFVVVVYLFVRYIKGLPQTIQTMQIEAYKSTLNSELERLKADLLREVELLKIHQMELVTRKAVQLDDFMGLIIEMFDKDFLKKMQSRAYQKEFHGRMMAFGAKLFVYGSDQTVRKFIEFKTYGNKQGTDDYVPFFHVILLAQLIIQIRKDIGNTETQLDYEDFLSMMLKNWGEDREKYAHLLHQVKSGS